MIMAVRIDPGHPIQSFRSNGLAPV
jgi:hypothetical protein